MKLIEMNLTGISESLVGSLIRERLPRFERDRIMKKRQWQDRRDSLFGYLLSRNILAEECGVPEQELDLKRSDLGKLYLSSDEFYCSLSHSNGVLRFVCADSPCGIDVEKIEPIPYASVIDQICSESEQRALNSVEVYQKAETFLIYGLQKRHI